MRNKRKIHRTRKDTSTKARKTVKKKTAAKGRVPKTRNAGTMTEAQFFQRIRSGLRQVFRYWKPMLKALEMASRPYVGPNKRQRKEYQCACCHSWFIRTAVEIDHIEECGSLSCYDDITSFIQRLTPEEVDAFQILCKPCHKDKTKEYKESKKKIA